MRLTMEIVEQVNHKCNADDVDNDVQRVIFLAVAADGVGIVKGKQAKKHPKKVVDVVAAGKYLY